MRSYTILALMIALFASAALAGDWPQFLGPNRTGISDEKGLATTWPEKGPKELWKRDMKAGFGGAAIRDKEVYVMDRDGAKDIVLCLDLASGKELWKFEYDAPGDVQYPGPRATPTVDDKYVFTMGAFGDLYCLDRKTHKDLWHKNILKEYDSARPNWAVSQSPCVYKDMVIVAPIGAKVGVVALDKATGKQIWASDWDKSMGPMAYQSPLVVQIGESTQVVMYGHTTLVGVDIKTGKTLWSYDKWKCAWPIPSPTYLGDGKFFVSGGYGSPCIIVQAKLDGTSWSATELVRKKTCQSKIHNVLLYDGHLYANSADNGQGLICMDLTGEIKWAKSGLSDMGGNLIIADGMIYHMAGQDGTLYLIKATADGYKELAKAKVLSGDTIWAPMAMSDGMLVVRDQKQIKCLDVKGK